MMAPYSKATTSSGRFVQTARTVLGARHVLLRQVVQAVIPAPMRARLLAGGPYKVDRTQWEREYATGYGEAMRSLGQLPRNSMIAGYCGMLGRGSVLDIGCGIGVLRRHLAPLGYTDYVGIDLSQTAIEQARREAPASARFEVAVAEDYQPGRQFDVIVFNEMLYYLDEPETLVKRCADFLEKDGVFIISLLDTGQSWRSWWRCSNGLTVLDEVAVRRARNRTWRVRVCQPKASRNTSKRSPLEADFRQAAEDR